MTCQGSKISNTPEIDSFAGYFPVFGIKEGTKGILGECGRKKVQDS